MPSLFTLPKQVPLSSGGGLLPGAKLYFFQTGTTTPQNTYQDVDLATPHAHPVEADAAGVFPPIYLDPESPHYRARLTTSADVQIWQIDDVPSNQNTAQTFSLVDDTPELTFDETDASANNRKWSIRAQGEALSIDLLNDAESVRTNVVTFRRAATTSLGADFATGNLLLNGESVADVVGDTFTGTLTGMSASTTGTINVIRIGALLTALRRVGDLTGTSNATTMTMTGVPAAYAPKAGFSPQYGLCIMYDNGNLIGGTASINSSGVITFGAGINPGGAFTGSGTKGIPDGWLFIFSR